MIRSIDVSAVLRQAVRATYADLVTRATGRAVREHIEQIYVAAVPPADVTRMDFAGVRCIDYSCADEIVAKLLRERIRVLVLRGCSEAHLEALVPVLEGHGLAVLLEHADGTLDGLGPRDTAEALIEELVTLRLAARTAGGVVALVAA
jgi:hypothetical protein